MARAIRKLKQKEAAYRPETIEVIKKSIDSIVKEQADSLNSRTRAEQIGGLEKLRGILGEMEAKCNNPQLLEFIKIRIGGINHALKVIMNGKKK